MPPTCSTSPFLQALPCTSLQLHCPLLLAHYTFPQITLSYYPHFFRNKNSQTTTSCGLHSFAKHILSISCILPSTTLCTILGAIIFYRVRSSLLKNPEILYDQDSNILKTLLHHHPQAQVRQGKRETISVSIHIFYSRTVIFLKSVLGCVVIVEKS